MVYIDGFLVKHLKQKNPKEKHPAQKSEEVNNKKKFIWIY